jgi:hypothetical protein
MHVGVVEETPFGETVCTNHACGSTTLKSAVRNRLKRGYEAMTR